jgi:DNA-binding NarL/FixJ family response regulator
MKLPTIRLMLVDDHALVRMGLKALLEIEPDFVVVAEADDGVAALEQYAIQQPDVTLLDIRMPRMDGLQTLERLLVRRPDARIIMLTTSELEDEIERAVELGACGYLLKKITGDELARAIRLVHSGEICLPAEVTRRLAANRLAPRLSEREREVLALLPRGLTNPEIAHALGITLNTAKTHLHTIFSKLDVANRAEAVSSALQRGLLQLDK